MIETNHHKIRSRLEKRGWKKKEIDKTLNILSKAGGHPIDKHLFWIFIVFFVLGSLAIFTGAFPVMALFPQASILVIAVLGICLGLFSDYVLRHSDIGHRHYVFMILIFPIASLLCLSLVTFLMYYFKGISINLNPLAAVTAYAICYSLPHFMHKVRQ